MPSITSGLTHIVPANHKEHILDDDTVIESNENAKKSDVRQSDEPERSLTPATDDAVTLTDGTTPNTPLSSSASTVNIVDSPTLTSHPGSKAQSQGQPCDVESQKAEEESVPETQKEKEEEKEKKVRGWPERAPFFQNHVDIQKKWFEESVFWTDLTWQEKMQYRKAFLREYLSETRRCLPYVRKLFLMIYRISPWRAIAVFALNIVNGLVPAINLHTTGDFMSLLQSGLERGKLDKRGLVRLIIRQAFAMLVDKINEDLMLKANEYLNTKLRQQFEIGLFKGYLELDISEMKDQTTLLYFREARRLLHNDGMGMFTKQLGLFREVTSIVARMAALLSLTNDKSWHILSIVACYPLFERFIEMLPIFSRQTYQRPLGRMLHHRMEYERHSLDRIAGDRSARAELMIFNAKDWLLQRYKHLTEFLTAAKEAGKYGYIKEEAPFAQKHILPILQNCVRSGVYLLVAYQPDYFGMPISQLSFLESSFQGILASISHFQNTVSHTLIYDMFSIRNLFECMDFKSKVVAPDNPAPYKSSPRGMKIEVRDLTFRYKKESPAVLKDVSFTVEPGQIVCIVGYNGSGKSTLIRLLTLLEKPTKGTILINDVDVKDYDPTVLRTNMSVLFQQFRKYEEISAQCNIGMGNPSVLEDLKTIRQAANDSGAEDFIRTFGSFYQTLLRPEYRSSSEAAPPPPSMSRVDEEEKPFMMKVLSRQPYVDAKWNGKSLLFWATKPEKKIDTKIPDHDEESDVSEWIEYRALSGGQWQRVALARAFMKIKDADLLILDEPSSALDPQAEYQVFKSIMDLRKDKTTIYISHRFHTVRAATKILLFEEGKLIETGTHEDLVDVKGGKYAHLYRLQSEGYAEFNNSDKKDTTITTA